MYAEQIDRTSCLNLKADETFKLTVNVSKLTWLNTFNQIKSINSLIPPRLIIIYCTRRRNQCTGRNFFAKCPKHPRSGQYISTRKAKALSTVLNKTSIITLHCYKLGQEKKKLGTSGIKIGNSKWELIYQGRLTVGNEVSVARLPHHLRISILGESPHRIFY